MIWVPFSVSHVGLILRSLGVWSALVVHVLLQSLHHLSQRITISLWTLTWVLTQPNCSSDSVLSTLSVYSALLTIFSTHVIKNAILSLCAKKCFYQESKPQFDLHACSSLCKIRTISQAPVAGGECLLYISHFMSTTCEEHNARY